jgi:hypothetical protein
MPRGRGKNKKNRDQHRVVGRTTDGKVVMTGLFKLYNSRGMPLEDILENCKDHNIVIDWIAFYREARDKGWTMDTFVRLLSDPLTDVYDSEYRDTVISTLKTIVR